LKEGSGNAVSLSLCVSSVRGTWRRAPLLGTLKDMVGKVLEIGTCFHMDPILGSMEGTLLSQ